MKYTPRYFTPEKLIRAVGFRKATNRGWEIPVNASGKFRKGIGKRRLHAFIHHGYVDIHYDGPKHISVRNNKLVVATMEKIKALDTRKVYWKVKFLKLKRKIYGKKK